MLTRLFLLTSFMLPHLVGASDCHPDSLRAVAQAMEASSSKIEVLYDLSVCYNFGSLDSSLHYIEEAVALSRSLNDRAWLCRCNSRYGLELAKQARYPEAEAAFLKGEGHCNTDIELAKLYNNRAIFYGMANRLVEGKRELLKGLNINRKSGNRDGEAKSMMNLAINHMRLSEHSEALDYAHRALSINESLQKPVNLGINLSMLSSIYMELEDVDNAVRYLDQAIPYFRQQNMTARLGYATFNRASLLNDQNKIAEAITAYLEAAAILEDINDQRALGTVYLELGDLYQKRNQFEEALDIIEPNIERTRASQNYPDLVQTIATRGLVRAKQGAYRVAYADAEESLRIAKEQRLLKDQQQPYELFILLDSLTGNYRQGLIHLKSYMALNDSVLGLAETEKIAEMKTRLETSEKEKAILLLESDNLRKDELALAQRKRLSWGVAGLGGLILLAAYLFWQRSRLRRTQSALESSLREKDVLLREIHHRVKNNLQLIMSLLNLQATEDQEQTVQDFLYKGQHRVRAIALIHEQLYRSDQLELIDLGTYTENLVSSIRETHGMEHINYTINTEETFLDIDKAVPLGIIINELVTNSLKHAFEGMDTGKISVSLHEERYELRLRVHDNGIGFPEQPANNSLGLELVRLLVKQLRGSLEIDGSRGTSISIQIAK